MRVSRGSIRLSIVLMLCTATVSPAVAQQVLLDAPVQAGELTLYPVLGENLEPGPDHYYVPTQARLAEDARGRPQFSFLRYVENVRPGEDGETPREGEGGGIVHAVVQLDVEDSAVRAAEAALQRERPGARIVGPVVYRSGTFGLVSSFEQEDGDLTRQVVGLGAAPVLEGSRAAISMRLTKLGAKILWESFEMPQPEISFVFEMQMEGLRAPVRARLEADWDRMYRHTAFGAGVATQVLAGEAAAAFDDLRDQGAIRLVQVGEDAQLEKMVQVAYDKLATLMFEPLEGTGMPSLGQLAGQDGGGGLLDRATKMLADARAEADQVRQVAEADARPRNEPGPEPQTNQPADQDRAEKQEQERPKSAPDSRANAGSLDAAEIERLQKEATVADLRVGYLERKVGAVNANNPAWEPGADASRVDEVTYACAMEYAEVVEDRLIRFAERSRAEAVRLRNRLAREGIEAAPSSDPDVHRLAILLTGRAGGEAELTMYQYCHAKLSELEDEELSEADAARLESHLEFTAAGIAENQEWLAERDAEIDEARTTLGLTADDVQAIVVDAPARGSEPESGQHIKTIAVEDAEKAGPLPEREVVRDEASRRGGDGAGGNAGAGAGGAAGGGGADRASASRPNIAAVATLQLRRTRQRGTFELDMNKYMAGSQPITFTQPIGDLSRYKDDETVFRQVNLDQPLFRQREVAFRLDGLNAEDFGEYVNFVHVQLRRGEDVREELTVGAEQFNERGHDFRLIYGFSGEESRDEWMRYEYRTVWSLFGGVSVEQPWERGTDGTVALPAPYIRRTIDLEGDPGALEGVRAVTARLYYTAGKEERFSELTLRPDRGETVGTADVLLPHGETEYDYEITWLYGNDDATSSGRQSTSNPILFLDPPQE